MNTSNIPYIYHSPFIYHTLLHTITYHTYTYHSTTHLTHMPYKHTTYIYHRNTTHRACARTHVHTHTRTVRVSTQTRGCQGTQVCWCSQQETKHGKGRQPCSSPSRPFTVWRCTHHAQPRASRANFHLRTCWLSNAGSIFFGHSVSLTKVCGANSSESLNLRHFLLG